MYRRYGVFWANYVKERHMCGGWNAESANRRYNIRYRNHKQKWNAYLNDSSNTYSTTSKNHKKKMSSKKWNNYYIKKEILCFFSFSLLNCSLSYTFYWCECVRVFDCHTLALILILCSYHVHSCVVSLMQNYIIINKLVIETLSVSEYD